MITISFVAYKTVGTDNYLYYRYLLYDMENQQLMTVREIRGRTIISKGIRPEALNQDTYLMPSQSSNEKYQVIRTENYWTCTCPDYKFRREVCKHIHAVKFWLMLREKMNAQPQIIRQEEQDKCVYCGSIEIIKRGIRKNDYESKQRFYCKICRRTFVSDSAFRKIRGNPKTITLVLDLYFKGISLRKIKEHLKEFYDVDVSHMTIYNWILRFTQLIKNYTDKLKPEVSAKWHTDEMTIKTKDEKKCVWLWNTIDSETRFLLAQNISETREIEDATKQFKDAVDKAQKKPVWMVTDKLPSYEKAFGKEIWSRKGVRREHIQIKGQTARANMKIERVHGSIREREKIIRAFKNPETAKKILDGWLIYYNYIRPHQTLNGLTPAEASGIDLKLDRNKWLSLLRQSLD
jgi:transposase-like protein